MFVKRQTGIKKERAAEIFPPRVLRAVWLFFVILKRVNFDGLPPSPVGEGGPRQRWMRSFRRDSSGVGARGAAQNDGEGGVALRENFRMTERRRSTDRGKGFE